MKRKNLKEDFGGVSGTFSLIDKACGGSFKVAQLKNNAKDKLATELLATEDGKMGV